MSRYTLWRAKRTNRYWKEESEVHLLSSSSVLLITFISFSKELFFVDMKFKVGVQLVNYTSIEFHVFVRFTTQWICPLFSILIFVLQYFQKAVFPALFFLLLLSFHQCFFLLSKQMASSLVCSFFNDYLLHSHYFAYITHQYLLHGNMYSLKRRDIFLNILFKRSKKIYYVYWKFSYYNTNISFWCRPNAILLKCTLYNEIFTLL